MASPSPNWDLVPVRGRYVGTDGTPVTGRVVFTPRSKRLVDAAALRTLIARPIAAVLDNGAFEVMLPASDDLDIVPNGFTYGVVEEFNGGYKYDIDVPLSMISTGVDISLAAPTEANNPGGLTPITRLEYEAFKTETLEAFGTTDAVMASAATDDESEFTGALRTRVAADIATPGTPIANELGAAVGGVIDTGMAPGGVIRAGVTPIAQAAASDAITANPSILNQAATQAGAAAAAAASTAVTITGVSDGYTAPPATPTVTLGTLNPVAANVGGGRRVLIAVADTHKITQPSVLRSMSGRVANDEAARTIEFYVYRPNGSGGYTVVYRSGAQAAATAGTYTWTPASYLRLLPGDVPGVWTATNVAANGLYWAGSGGPAIGSILYQPAANSPAPAVGDTITPGAGTSDPKIQTQYLPALTWTTSHEAVVVASRWANQPGGYPRLDAGGKVPANLLPGARLTGLPVTVLGTSIIATANSYVTQAAALAGIVLDNQAVGSSGIVWDGTRDRSFSATKAELEAAFPGWGGQSYEARIIDRIANIKHLHFAHGYNDRDKPIGTPTSTDRATLYGAYNYVLSKVFEAKPSITVSFETPHSLYTPANEGYHATTAAARTAILELGQRYGGPVFDLTQHGQLGQSGATTRTTDGVHPNAAWNTMLAPVLAAWWNEHLPVG